MKNNRLTHLGEMPGVGGRFARVGGFSPTEFTCKKLLWEKRREEAANDSPKHVIQVMRMPRRKSCIADRSSRLRREAFPYVTRES